MNINKLLLGMLLAGLALPAAAEVYKWVDVNGKMHFTDQPPPRTRVEAVKVKPIPAPKPATKAASEPAEKTPGSGKPEDLAKQAEALNAKIKAENQKIREKNCVTARANVELLNTGKRVQSQQADGSSKSYSGDDREKLRRQYEDEAKKWCSPTP